MRFRRSVIAPYGARVRHRPRHHRDLVRDDEIVVLGMLLPELLALVREIVAAYATRGVDIDVHVTTTTTAWLCSQQ